MHAQDKVGARDFPATEPAFRATIDVRERLGYFFLIAGAANFVAALVVASCAVSHIEFDAANPVSLRIAYLKFAGHSVITVSWVLFSYGLVRAGERMFVPRWLLRGDVVDVEVIRAILGIDTPVSAALKLTREVGATIAKVAQPIVDSVKR